MANNKRNSLSIYALDKQISQNLSEENLKGIRGSDGGGYCIDCHEHLSSKDFSQFYPFLEDPV